MPACTIMPIHERSWADSCRNHSIRPSICFTAARLIVPLLDTPPLFGRTLLPRDDEQGSERVVVVSYGVWQRRLGMDSTAIGRTITLNDVPRVVVGVMRRY